MNTFVDAVINQEARTENGMKARKSSANSVVDLFYNIGALRGKDVVPAFTAAFVQDRGGGAAGDRGRARRVAGAPARPRPSSPTR